MHSFYLRSCYLHNQLAKGEMELAGQRLDLKDVDQDLYIVAAINDHIVPWTSSYATITRCSAGDARFVLSSGGHIAGIVNPPEPQGLVRGGRETTRRRRGRGGSRPPRQQGSWWEDWAWWAGERAGGQIEPPAIGSDRHPVLGDGPGEYVRT